MKEFLAYVIVIAIEIILLAIIIAFDVRWLTVVLILYLFLAPLILALFEKPIDRKNNDKSKTYNPIDQ